MKLSLILFFIAGVAATEKGSAATEQAGSLRRALKGPPDWSCEKRNEGDALFQAGCPNPAIGKKGKGNDPCEACCECECDEGILTPKSLCMEVGCDAGAIPLGSATDCATACGSCS